MLIAKKIIGLLLFTYQKKTTDESYEWGISKADVSTGELITLEGQSLYKTI